MISTVFTDTIFGWRIVIIYNTNTNHITVSTTKANISTDPFVKNQITIKGNIAEVELTQGQVATIDAEDVDRIKKYRWYACYPHSKSYATTHMRKKGTWKIVYMQRFIMKPNYNQEVGFINRNRMDLRKSNLRLVNHQQNHFNDRKRKTWAVTPTFSCI